MKNRLQRATDAIEADLESSKRHWTEVRDAAAVRAADETASRNWRERNEKQYLVAVKALAALERGEHVSIWGDR